MNDADIAKLRINDLITLVTEYRTRFKQMNEIVNSYGQISNDDMIGFIHKLIPDDLK
jgi:hypothetical protein